MEKCNDIVQFPEMQRGPEQTWTEDMTNKSSRVDYLNVPHVICLWEAMGIWCQLRVIPQVKGCGRMVPRHKRTVSMLLKGLQTLVLTSNYGATMLNDNLIDNSHEIFPNIEWQEAMTTTNTWWIKNWCHHEVASKWCNLQVTLDRA